MTDIDLGPWCLMSREHHLISLKWLFSACYHSVCQSTCGQYCVLLHCTILLYLTLRNQWVLSVSVERGLTYVVQQLCSLSDKSDWMDPQMLSSSADSPRHLADSVNQQFARIKQGLPFFVTSWCTICQESFRAYQKGVKISFHLCVPGLLSELCYWDWWLRTWSTGHV